MSNNVVFKLNLKGLNEVMKSPGMQKYLQEAASQVTGSAGKGYGSDVKIASYEAIAKIYPQTGAAARDNGDNNTLLKTLQVVGLPLTKEG